MDKRYAIFDMDGTLTDSMRFWRDLGGDYLAAKGLHPDPELVRVVQTMTMHQGARHFMDCFGLAGPEQVIVDEMNAIMAGHYRRDVPLKPGVAAYLEMLAARGVKMCVATATAGPLARDCLERLGVADRFEAILSSEDLGVSKERPDLFFLAARQLGGAPEETAVFEDALYAARTAKAAGFYTVGVYDPWGDGTWETLRALADETITDWRNLL